VREAGCCFVCGVGLFFCCVRNGMLYLFACEAGCSLCDNWGVSARGGMLFCV